MGTKNWSEVATMINLIHFIRVLTKITIVLASSYSTQMREGLIEILPCTERYNAKAQFTQQQCFYASDTIQVVLTTWIVCWAASLIQEKATLS